MAKRVYYIDALRVFCIFCVMLLHTAGSRWAQVPVTEGTWWVLNSYDGLVRFCVPVMIMISGSMFLDPSRPVTMRSLCCKNIPRLVTAFLFWSAAYAMQLWWGNGFARHGEVIGKVLHAFAFGHYHLWFLFMLVGLYLITPFLREIVKNPFLCRYFLIMSFGIGICVPLLAYFPAFASFGKWIDRFQIKFILGYSFYFVLGYFLYSTKLSGKCRAFVYSMGAIGVTTTILGTGYLSATAGKASQLLYGYSTPNCAFSAAAVFLFFQSVIGKMGWTGAWEKGLLKLSQISFGMYLIHDFFNILLKNHEISAVSFSPIWGVPILTVFVFLSSLCIAWIIDKIPILNRYLM